MLEWFCAPSQVDTGGGHQDCGRNAVRLRLRLSLPSKEVSLGSTLCNGITLRYHSEHPPEKCISAGVLQPCSVITIIYLSVTIKLSSKMSPFPSYDFGLGMVLKPRNSHELQRHDTGCRGCRLTAWLSPLTSHI